MTIQKLTIIICSISLLNGCSNDDDAIEEISYEIIEERSLSYSDEAQIEKQYIVFESENEWLNFIPIIESVNPYQAEDLKNMDFNFTSEDLIIVIGEFFNSCCTQITINRVYRKNKNVIVDFEESKPGMLGALSQAYVVLKIPKANK